MFRIAICDDESAICEEIKNAIAWDEKLKDFDISIDIFHSGEELFTFLEKSHAFELIILDIELPTMNGVEIGSKLRNQRKDEFTQILYISSKQGYAMELFDNRPLNFLVKPIDRDKLTRLVQKAMEINGIGTTLFEFKQDGQMQSIACKDIRFFYSDNKQIHMMTGNEKKTFYGKMDDVQNSLTDRNFIRIHKSTLVNYEYIAKASYGEIQLTTGELLSISQRYRAEVRATLNQSRKKRR